MLSNLFRRRNENKRANKRSTTVRDYIPRAREHLRLLDAINEKRRQATGNVPRPSIGGFYQKTVDGMRFTVDNLEAGLNVMDIVSPGISAKFRLYSAKNETCVERGFADRCSMAKEHPSVIVSACAKWCL